LAIWIVKPSDVASIVPQRRLIFDYNGEHIGMPETRPLQMRAQYARHEADMIAIDGKTSRRSHARGKGSLPLHTASAWATRQRLVLGQAAVAEKSNTDHRHRIAVAAS
jgi:hypothetical protein